MACRGKLVFSCCPLFVMKSNHLAIPSHFQYDMLLTSKATRLKSTSIACIAVLSCTSSYIALFPSLSLSLSLSYFCLSLSLSASRKACVALVLFEKRTEHGACIVWSIYACNQGRQAGCRPLTSYYPRQEHNSKKRTRPIIQESIPASQPCIAIAISSYQAAAPSDPTLAGLG